MSYISLQWFQGCLNILNRIFDNFIHKLLSQYVPIFIQIREQHMLIIVTGFKFRRSFLISHRFGVEFFVVEERDEIVFGNDDIDKRNGQTDPWHCFSSIADMSIKDDSSYRSKNKGEVEQIKSERNCG